ncbi:MAG TPA: hypothetical protein VJP85_00075 [Candidatus Baltobacteraceae bacterium]|nr:hypothetical protein [Candidatus Baltobacteraceae bacterium]
MSAEWVTAIATAGTFFVIAASASAALVQLRHMRTSNQVLIMNELRNKMDSAEFKRAVRFIRYELPDRMRSDSEFRRTLLANTGPEAEMIADVGEFFDFEASQLVKHNMVDARLACDWLYSPVVPCWDALAPLISSRRAMLGYSVWEDFEYLALLCKRFRQRYPEGTYPRGTERLPLPAPWPEALSREPAQ